MSRYTDRRWSLSVEDEVLIEETSGRQFKCTFTILHDFGGFTSYAEINLYNLTDDTINRMFKRGKSLTFRAGYSDSIDTIFKGTIRNVFPERRGPDKITKVICRGGKLAVDQSQINQTLGANTQLVDIIRACGTSMGYPIVIDDSQFSDIAPYPYGYTLQGDPRTYLDELAQTHGFDYVVENERLVVVRQGYTRQGTVNIISQFTGMEGIPEISEIGVDVVTRLNPKLRIGGRFRIESDLATFNFSNLYFRDVPESAGQGEHKIIKIEYTGDTWGDAWSNKIFGLRIRS